MSDTELFSDRETYAPLVLFEYDHAPGSYCLMLSDDHMVPRKKTFTTNGREANGYGWADVALQVMRTSAPELESRLGIDPEAGLFVAYGTDLEALQKLGSLLHNAYHDDAVLGPLVASAPWEYD